jgi:16S rRNA processing protein RimM
MTTGARICLGQIGAAHGVRGEVRLRTFTADPEAITGYGPLETDDGRIVEIESLRPAKDHFVAKLSGIGDRDAAARLTNVKLYVSRDRLPALDSADEFYHADLIGLSVADRAGHNRGTVIAVHNFGAGDLIEVRPDIGGETDLVPFDDRHVPLIDLASRRMIVDQPSAPAATVAGAGDASGAKPGPARHPALDSAAARPFHRTAAGSRRKRSSLSRKRRG